MELIDSSMQIENIDYLRKFAETNGYLFFKKKLSIANLKKFKEIVLLKMNDLGWLDNNYKIEEGVVKEGVFIGESFNRSWVEFYQTVTQLQLLTEITFDPQLHALLKIVLKDPILPHCRQVFRALSPSSNKFATPPHRDYTWTGGTKDTWTTWIPLMDIDMKLGGVELIPGSHLMTFQPIKGDETKGWMIDELLPWATCSNYELGDVLLFHSMTIHAGKSNKTDNKIRFSLDCRFQNANDPIRKDSLCSHWNELFGIDWEKIYEGWDAKSPYKYYWRKFKNVVDHTEGTFQQDLSKRYIMYKVMNAFK